jgi:DNA-binding beta-propeller fold protein YncE
MKLACCALLLIATRTFPQQSSAPSERPDSGPLRDEIQTIEKLLSRLPDRAPALFVLAHDYASLGDLRKGMSLLQECAALHEGFNPEGDPAFARLKDDPEFRALVEQLRREFPQVQRARLAFTVPQPDLIPEGLAVNPTKHFFYMGSLSRKKIVKISPTGVVSDFVPAGRYEVQSICGIKVDSHDEDVWANTCPDSGKGAELLRFNSAGKLLERFSQTTAGPHLFNDLVLRNRDEIYLTDSLAHQALRFDRRTHAFTALLFPRPLYYPNGIALSGDGNLLYVADAFGVLQYDLRSQKSREVEPGPSNTVSGFDGLYWYRGSLIGIQNSMGLPRAVRFQLSRDGSRVTATTILEYRSPNVELPTTGAIDGDNFYFMSNTQIDNWKNEQIVDAAKLTAVRMAVIHLD